MKDKVLMTMLDSAFKSVSNFQKDKEIQDAFFYILEKANVLLLIANERVSANLPMTDKKRKKEDGTLKLLLKIEKEAEKKMEIIISLEKNVELIKDFKEKISIFKELLK
jgi:hypothetical protein